MSRGRARLMVIAVTFMTVPEVAELLRTPVSTVRFWIRTDKLPSIKPGRRRLVRRADVAKLAGLPLTELVTDEGEEGRS